MRAQNYSELLRRIFTRHPFEVSRLTPRPSLGPVCAMTSEQVASGDRTVLAARSTV